MNDRARSTAAHTQHSSAMQLAARLGFAVNGLLNVMIGGLALGVAGSAASGGADPNGALTGLAQGPGGQVLIWVIVVGLLGLAVWQIASAVQERDPDARRLWAARAKSVGKGVAYAAIAVVGIRVALGSGGGGGGEEDVTAQALATPGGVVLVVLVGLGTLGVGGYLVAKGVRKKFLDDVSLPAGRVATGVTVLGMVGYIARGIAFGMIGILFLVAAVTADPSSAGGLDDALAALAALPFGAVVLVAVALGFIAYGLYGFVRARFARL
ncbi:DUF1206 domain-containing protein [Pseudolysinimonas sp.]|jgi:hypothetical protein|uniref:DUF1206 domain-containing protein n=1 Tax=Pseudolysinimonas sp. TaxID=2680009 RepID=UPI0037845A86